MHLLAWKLAPVLLALSAHETSALSGAFQGSVAQSPAPAAAPESAALQEASELFARAKEAHARKDLDQARAQAGRAVAVLAALAPGALAPQGDGILLELGTFAREVGDVKSARVAGERVLRDREARLPPDHAALAVAQDQLAITLHALGDFAAARALFERVLEGFERTRPADHADVTQARWNLALTLKILGELRAAREQFERVVDVRERTLPADHADLAAARQGLSSTLYTLGDLPAARALAERVLEVRERTLPPDHHDLADARQGMAVLLSMSGDLHGARSLQERVLEVRERTLSADHASLAMARLNLAVTLFSLGDLHGTRALQERALETFGRTLPADHPDLDLARANLANTLRVLGDLPAARTLQEAVLELRERTLPADHPDLAMARGNLANTLRILGELQQALTLERLVLEVRERTFPSDHPDLTAARENLANTLHDLGDSKAAHGLFERVLEVRERTLPADHLDLAATRQNLALTLKEAGELSAARALEERVLEVLERTLPADHPRLASAQHNLAGTLWQLGDLRPAHALLVRVLEVLERTLPADHPDLARARMDQANVLQQLGDLEAARALKELGLEAFERNLPADNLYLARTRASLAQTLATLGDLPAARALQTLGVESLERALPADHPYLVQAQLNLARTLRMLGDLAGARALEQRGLEVFQRTLPAGHRDLTGVRGNLAITLGELLTMGRERGDEQQALQSALRTLALDLPRGQRRWAQSALLEGSPREVEERLASQDVVLAVALSLARGYGIVDLGAEVLGEVFLLGESSRAGGLVAARLAARTRGDEVAGELRARIARDTETLARLAHAGGGAEELRRTRAALDQAGRELARHASALLGSAAAIDPTLEDLTRGLGMREALVTWRRAALLTLQRGDPATWSEVDSLIAFVVRPGVPIEGLAAAQQAPQLELVDLGPVAPIEAAIERWRERIGTPVERGVAAAAGEPSLTALGEEVRARVLDPLRGALEGVERVSAVLDDALHALPLDALPAGVAWARGGSGAEESATGAESFRPLGDVLKIEVRTSLIELLLPQKPRAGATSLLAIGHPAFDLDPASAEEAAQATDVAAPTTTRSGADAGPLRGGMWERGFGTLPETRAEVRGIGQYFEDTFGAQAPALLLERRQASREALIELAPRARWLHVATHGWFAPESVRSSADLEPQGASARTGLRLGEAERVRGMSPMLLCGLALAGANLPVNAVGRIPGLVTAQEIAALDLSNCELAVLSACDTNVGVRRAGQGVASLQKALHMAGARSVITSLWKVPDEATKDLMIDFYRRLWVEKKPKHQALWEAKNKLRDARDERGRPKYTTRDWAAWVLTGAPD